MFSGNCFQIAPYILLSRKNITLLGLSKVETQSNSHALCVVSFKIYEGLLSLAYVAVFA
jgi:hypothetical protein